MYPSNIQRICLFAMLGLFLILSGCTGKGMGKLGIGDKYERDPDEVIQEPYTPRDDGLPLSASELKAFKSKGDLDRNLSQEDSQIVELHFKFFVHERRRTFERYLQRSARYLPYVKKVFVERGLPEDLAYLFMVESGGNPNAISPVGATGLWQFMPFTGKKYGLVQNAWIDERRDPFKATYAASDYLLKLMYDFNDWHLAAAAYNAGEGKIGRAVNGTGAEDFFELCRLDCNLEEKARLRDETRQYVPRLIAVAKIMRNLELLGFVRPSLADAYDLTPVTVPAGTNLRGLAQNLGVTWDEFSAMNPGFKRTASPPNASSIAYVPPAQVASVNTWLASSEARLYASWKEHTVRKKESLNSIAKRYKVSVASLKEANGISKLPRVGTVIMIPKGSVSEAVVDARPSSIKATARSGKYTVKSGDSLFSLAQTWGTDVDTIRQLNGLGSDKLKLGQKLSIPATGKGVAVSPDAPLRDKKPKKDAVAQPSVTYTTYKVKSGDTLFSIAQRYGISVNTLRNINGMKEKAPLQPNKTIKVPATAPVATSKQASDKGSATAPAKGQVKAAADKPTNAPKVATPKAASTPKAATSANPKTVTVGQGDTLYSLAKKYNTSVKELEKVNKLSKNSKIKLGQTLRLP